MIDTHGVAEFDGVEDLVKDIANERIHLETLIGEGNVDAVFLGSARSGARQHIALCLCDHAEEVAIWAVIEDDVDTGALWIVDDTVKGDDVGVSRSHGVEHDLTTLESTLASIKADFVETLDGIVAGSVTLLGGEERGRGLVRRGGGVRALVLVEVTSKVDDTVSAKTENRDELQAPIGNAVADEVLVLLVSTRRRHDGRRTRQGV